MGAPMTARPLDAVSCAGPVHPPVKDHAGLVPNTLKLVLVLVSVLVLVLVLALV